MIHSSFHRPRNHYSGPVLNDENAVASRGGVASVKFVDENSNFSRGATPLKVAKASGGGLMTQKTPRAGGRRALGDISNRKASRDFRDPSALPAKVSLLKVRSGSKKQQVQRQAVPVIRPDTGALKSTKKVGLTLRRSSVRQQPQQSRPVEDREFPAGGGIYDESADLAHMLHYTNSYNDDPSDPNLYRLDETFSKLPMYSDPACRVVLEREELHREAERKEEEEASRIEGEHMKFLREAAEEPDIFQENELLDYYDNALKSRKKVGLGNAERKQRSVVSSSLRRPSVRQQPQQSRPVEDIEFPAGGGIYDESADLAHMHQYANSYNDDPSDPNLYQLDETLLKLRMYSDPACRAVLQRKEFHREAEKKEEEEASRIEREHMEFLLEAVEEPDIFHENELSDYYDNVHQGSLAVPDLEGWTLPDAPL